MSESVDIGNGKLYMNGEHIGEVNDKETVKTKHSKAIGCLTIDVDIKGYDKAKQQLRNLEATFDRILEKQERVGSVVNHVRHKAMKIMIDGKVYDIECDTPSRERIKIEELVMELDHYIKQQRYKNDGK